MGLSLLAVTFGLVMTAIGVAASTPVPNSVVFKERIFNDCPTSTVTTMDQFPAEISIEDAGLDCLGFANLHNWRFSENGVDPAVYDNNSVFRFAADLTITGSGNGEAGLQIAPWWSQDVDGRFNVRSTDGEIACFGGRLPFFSFTGTFAVNYVKGDPIHLEMIYDPHGLSMADPATIEYRLSYLGSDYTSGPLAFDEGNPAEDPPHGLWGMLNNGRVGGYLQAFNTAGVPTNVKATWENVQGGTPSPNSAVFKERIFDDCPTSTVTTESNYPYLVSIKDADLDCLGFANLHNWRLSENGVDPAVFNNNATFRFGADLVIEGTGNGEAGLQIAPWWSKDVDGRFNVRSTDGEIACFGGRLPFFSFTGTFGVTYTKGDPIHLEVIYDPHSLSMAAPATIEYRLSYLGSDYTSGPLAFDEANPAEDPPHGLWGMLNDARVGGYLQSFVTTGNPTMVKASWTNAHFSTCLHPVPMAFDIKPNKLNLKGKSKKLTVYITPEAPYGPGDIDPASLRLNGVPIMSEYPPQLKSKKLKVRFPRQEVQATFGLEGGLKATKMTLPVWLAGKVGGECFDSAQLVEVKVPKMKKPKMDDVLAPGQVADVEWDLFADDVNPPTVTLLATFDEGQSWVVQAEGIPNTGHYSWQVPNVLAGTARLQIVEVFEIDEFGVVNQAEFATSDPFSISSALGVLPGARVGLELYGAQPNPSRGLTVSFALPQAGPAKIDVFDVSGRQVATREVGALGVGRHTVTLAGAGTLRAGVYLVRLMQGAQYRNARAVVIE